jgi:hypothetical protein
VFSDPGGASHVSRGNVLFPSPTETSTNRSEKSPAMWQDAALSEAELREVRAPRVLVSSVDEPHFHHRVRGQRVALQIFEIGLQQSSPKVLMSLMPSTRANVHSEVKAAPLLTAKSHPG